MGADHLHKAIQERGLLSLVREVQLAWVTTRGWTQTYFLVHIALVGLVTPMAYWIGYQSTFGDQVVTALLQPERHPVTLLVLTGMRFFNWMCLVLPVVALISILWFAVTGMFQRQFWVDVARIQAETPSPRSA